MSVGVYMDENVHGSITQGVRRRGVDVLTAQEDGRAGIEDPLLMSRATELGRVMFSQDTDMLREATHRLRTGVHFSGLAFADQMGITIGQAIDGLELIAKVYDPDDIRDRVEHLPF